MMGNMFGNCLIGLWFMVCLFEEDLYLLKNYNIIKCYLMLLNVLKMGSIILLRNNLNLMGVALNGQ